MQETVPVDGAMGTTLQQRGLPPGVPADRWVDERPEEVAAVHRAFVDAGARVLRTATLCSRPDAGGSLLRLRRAVALAREAAPAEVWLSLGPLGPGRGSLAGLEAALDAGADRVVLETFLDPYELVSTASYLTARGGRVVASLVPGEAPYPVGQLRDAGVEVLGLNCGLAPEPALAAWRAARDDGPWFVAPPGGPGLEAVWRALVGEVAYLGGCCGVDPVRWEAAWPR